MFMFFHILDSNLENFNCVPEWNDGAILYPFSLQREVHSTDFGCTPEWMDAAIFHLLLCTEPNIRISIGWLRLYSGVTGHSHVQSFVIYRTKYAVVLRYTTMKTKITHFLRTIGISKINSSSKEYLVKWCVAYWVHNEKKMLYYLHITCIYHTFK